jgi:hypothetical protein
MGRHALGTDSKVIVSRLSRAHYLGGVIAFNQRDIREEPSRS